MTDDQLVDNFLALDAAMAAGSVPPEAEPFLGRVDEAIAMWLDREVSEAEPTPSHRRAIASYILDHAEEAWYPVGGGSYDLDRDRLADVLDAAVTSAMDPPA